jgi:hypothetical protein
MKQSDTNFPFNITQSIFQPSSSLRDATRQTATSFWNGQDQILNTMQEYANTWFERRHIGAHDALNISQQIADAATPIEAIREYQKWAMGCFERMMHDGLECQKQLLSIGSLLSPPLSPSSERTETEPVSGESRRRAQSRAGVSA